MRFGRVIGTAALLATSLPLFAASRSHHGTPSLHLSHKKSSRPQSRPAGQRSIDDARATEIQSALVSAGYLSGAPSGHWDSETESAMQHFQADNGWQTRLMPDSRAIIKLGLGPKATTVSDNVGGAAAFSSTR